jgi:hypothetical protein
MQRERIVPPVLLPKPGTSVAGNYTIKNILKSRLNEGVIFPRI